MSKKKNHAALLATAKQKRIAVEHKTVSDMSKGVFPRVEIRVGEGCIKLDGWAAEFYQRTYADHLFELPELDLDEVDLYTAVGLFSFSSEHQTC